MHAENASLVTCKFQSALHQPFFFHPRTRCDVEAGGNEQQQQQQQQQPDSSLAPPRVPAGSSSMYERLFSNLNAATLQHEPGRLEGGEDSRTGGRLEGGREGGRRD